MKIKRIKHTKETLKEFAEKHDLTLVIVENNTESKFTVFFENTEIKTFGIFECPVGTGDTLVDAVTNLLKQILGRTLHVVVGPGGVFRSVEVPNYILPFSAEDFE